MSKRKKNTLRQDVRGLRRASYFANGGNLATWRGRSVREPDGYHEANKKACRGRVIEDI